MKKIILSTFIALAVLTSIVYAAENVEISFRIGDNDLSINGNLVDTVAPYIVGEGVTLVPVRVITEAFGARVDWRQETKEVDLSVDNKTMTLAVGSKNVTLNGKNINIDAAPELSDDTTMVPLRFISENFGAEVKYDNGHITVIKNNVPQASAEPTPTAEPVSELVIAIEPIVTPSPAKYSGKTGFSVQLVIYPAKTGALIRMYDNTIDNKFKNEYDEWGVYISEDRKITEQSQKAVAKLTENTEMFEEPMTEYIVDCKKSGMTLKSDTAYYVTAYGVKDGEEYRGTVERFRTLVEEETIDVDGEVKDITDTNAVLCGIFTDMEDLILGSVNYVFYLGTSQDDMKPYVLDYKYDKISTTSYTSLVPDLKNGVKYDDRVYRDCTYQADINEDLGVMLNPDTTYYWKYMFVWDGEEFTTDMMTFKTDSSK